MGIFKNIIGQSSFRRKLKQMEKTAESTYGKGYVLFELGRYEEALEKYDEAADILDEMQQLLLEEGIEDEANNVAKRAMDIRFNKCFILFRLQRYEDTLQIIDETLSRKPEDPKIIFSKGFVLFSISRYEEALHILERAIEMQPEFPDPWYCKANALYQMELFEDALEAYSKAIEYAGIMDFEFPRYSFLNINPDPTIKTNAAGVWYSKANTLSKLGRTEEAIEAYSKALEIRKSFSDAWYCLGNCLAEAGRDEDAITALTNAIQIEPDLIAARENKAELLLKLGRPEEAKETLEYDPGTGN
ncbi:tetratricopeptide repeat protein [Methanococcoides sp. FTZ1]|uniref:tetratricopeptide repeat protein n=1 Tax=Methanococcoides sp. FTZ1 TaxID=3439061 RepID=UPI003F8578FF